MGQVILLTEARKTSEAMKEVSLTKGQTALVSDCDYERVMQHSWCMHPRGYAKARINKKYVLMHRWIMGVVDNVDLDHINGIKTDNRRENLRICNQSQNNANSRLRTVNTSGYKGVGWSEYHQMFRARLMIHRKDIFLGYFNNPEEAARAYDKKAIEIYGEFALVNFPTEKVNDTRC